MPEIDTMKFALILFVSGLAAIGFSLSLPPYKEGFVVSDFKTV